MSYNFKKRNELKIKLIINGNIIVYSSCPSPNTKYVNEWIKAL